MDNNEAREILIEHLDWKRSPTEKQPPYQFEIVCQAIDCAIQALGDGWVSVENPPEIDGGVCSGDYWVCTEGGYRCTGRYTLAGFWMKSNGSGMLNNVTHYQPLPSPPKPKQP